MDMISVVIPAYKKTAMLVENLRHNLRSLKGLEIIIVNDDPSKSIAGEMMEFDVTLVENKKNLGFGGAVNVGFAHAKQDYVLLLNSDVRLNNNAWKKALARIEQSNYFAISFAQTEGDGSTVGKNTIYWAHGFFLHKKAEDMRRGTTAWAEGGSCIINRKIFDVLGGFDLMYSPFYWEDIDLSYRAWKSGYEVLFEPAVLVEHRHESTIGTYFQKKQIDRIATRNQFIFMWKNMQGDLLTSHFIRLPLFLITTIMNTSTILGFLSALPYIPAIIRQRRIQQMLYKRTDREVLEMFK